MSTEERSWSEEQGEESEVEHPDERAPGGVVTRAEAESDEYEGPDPERGEKPRIADEDQGVWA